MNLRKFWRWFSRGPSMAPTQEVTWEWRLGVLLLVIMWLAVTIML